MSFQDGAQVRFEWGPTGAERVARGTAVAVVVDVFSFTTFVSVAVDHGVAVYPFGWHDPSAQQYADERGAVLAGSRGTAGRVSLSPGSITALQGAQRVVLPSRNGSTIAHLLAARGSPVVAAALRNRRAVARWVAHHAQERAVAVVAAGERWPDGTLRPAVEDLWAAGAVIAGLADLGIGGLSPEAATARGAFEAVPDLPEWLLACTSGQELVGNGYPEDVRFAAELDISTSVPLLQDGAFRAVRPDQG